MANKVYPKFKKASVTGGASVNLLTSSVKLVLVDTGQYTYSDAHEFLSDVPAGARIAISGALSSKAVSDLAAFTSANGRFDGVTGVSVEAIIIFVDTGDPATSRLVAYFDTSITGLPTTPAGASYNVIPPSGGWFVL